MVSWDSTSPTTLRLFYIVQKAKVVVVPKGGSQSQKYLLLTLDLAPKTSWVVPFL